MQRVMRGSAGAARGSLLSASSVTTPTTEILQEWLARYGTDYLSSLLADPDIVRLPPRGRKGQRQGPPAKIVLMRRAATGYQRLYWPSLPLARLRLNRHHLDPPRAYGENHNPRVVGSSPTAATTPLPARSPAHAPSRAAYSPHHSVACMLGKAWRQKPAGCTVASPKTCGG